MIKAAVVGVGHLGTYHAHKYFASNRAELVAVCDINEKKALEVATKYQTRAIVDYHELPSLGVQCASIACDTKDHYKVAKYLLNNEIDVLVEKPVCASTEEARDLIKCAKEKSRILQVGHLERFNPAFKEMKQFVNYPIFFEARRIMPFRGRGVDVDVVLDLMIHDIDIISYLVGSPLDRVEALGCPVLTDKVDIANARLEFKNGAVANINASRISLKSERIIRIFQQDGYLSLDYENKSLKMYGRSLEKDERGYRKIISKELSVASGDALADEIGDFLYTVKTRRNPSVTGEEGLLALEIAEKIKASIKESFNRQIMNSDDLGIRSQDSIPTVRLVGNY